MEPTMRAWTMFVATGALCALAGRLAVSSPPSPPESGESPRAAGPGDRSNWVTAVEPKALSGNVRRGLDWLVAHQHEGGGWSQGEESPNMGARVPEGAPPDVGDTCAAVLALIRSGSTPSAGPYAASIRKGLSFIMGQVEQSAYESLSVTSLQGTRLQAKLGPHIDTFLASMVLTEAAGRMPDQESGNRLASALDKVIYKIQQNQQANGMWDGQGWAPALAHACATKGLNRARQAGLQVRDDVLARAEGNAASAVAGGMAFGGEGAAGVALYAGAKNIAILQDSVNSNRARIEAVRAAAGPGATPEQQEQANAELARFADAEAAHGAAQQAMVDRLDDQQFVAGFGSNGGEEFLSYMNISESLVVKGGTEWKKWDEKMTENLNRIQNEDGSWTGHHFITGRTFCTASALLVLMADRTPVPAEALAAPMDSKR